jgi:hypothetical protein
MDNCSFDGCDRPLKSRRQSLCNTHYAQRRRGIPLREFIPKRSSSEVEAELTLGLRTCCDCKVQKPVSEFYKADAKGRGLSSICKSCDLSRRRENQYGISTPQWEEMFDRQGRVCAICSTATPGGQGWHTDHDHTLGPVRGILCTNCNLKLGHFEKWYLPNREAVNAYLSLEVEG